jgi:hypothetical protein
MPMQLIVAFNEAATMTVVDLPLVELVFLLWLDMVANIVCIMFVRLVKYEGQQRYGPVEQK